MWHFTDGVCSKVRRLLIISHVTHYRYMDSLYAYGPYAREIDIWADLFPQVLIAAPCRSERPPEDALPFTRPNIKILPQFETGGTAFKAKVYQLMMLPILLASLSRAMWKTDAVHVRCPGNLGLLGALLAPLFSRYRIAKYAGQWNGYPGEPWTVRLQRAILRSRWWGAPVIVYGQWPNQPKHVIPFFTSVMTEEQMSRARTVAARKTLSNPPHLLYVGRLSASKRVDVLLHALHQLYQDGQVFQLTIVGDGPERARLEKLAHVLALGGRVTFAGAVPFEKVLDFYERAHILVLVSETEGWPKAIVEGMAFGLVCIGSNRGLVPSLLGDGRGLTVPVGDVEGLVSALKQVIKEPALFHSMSRTAAAWAQQFTLESLREALREVMEKWWGVPIGRGIG